MVATRGSLAAKPKVSISIPRWAAMWRSSATKITSPTGSSASTTKCETNALGMTAPTVAIVAGRHCAPRH